jgi:hypothetical protein
MASTALELLAERFAGMRYSDGARMPRIWDKIRADSDKAG